MQRVLTRRNALRAIYALGLAGYTGYVYWYLTQFLPAFLRVAGFDLPDDITRVFWIAGVPAYLVVAAPFAVLAVRPMWWGKILMALCLAGAPMAWVASFAFSLALPAMTPQIEVAARFAYALAGLAIAQQIVDPTIWRPPDTWASKDCPPPWPFGRKGNGGPAGR